MKLSEYDLGEIRALKGMLPHRDVARAYGVSVSLVEKAGRGVYRRGPEGPAPRLVTRGLVNWILEHPEVSEEGKRQFARMLTRG